ncbi:hypothetical protein N665_0273s0003 [Sinapis alba]|nr:hypothetical protein N665_0273s0003 [Sinapis alba]
MVTNGRGEDGGEDASGEKLETYRGRGSKVGRYGRRDGGGAIGVSGACVVRYESCGSERSVVSGRGGGGGFYGVCFYEGGEGRGTGGGDGSIVIISGGSRGNGGEETYGGGRIYSGRYESGGGEGNDYGDSNGKIGDYG